MVSAAPATPAAFIEELDKAIQSILDVPKRWPIFESDCRRLPLFLFPYSVVYRERSKNLIQILAVAHGRRAPVIGEKGIAKLIARSRQSR
jgi:plasmid stabilization system protein ParE